MLISFVAFFIGIILGIIFGVIPGFHTNLLVLIAPFLMNYFNSLEIGILIISTVTASIFFEFLRSTFIGIPNEISSLSVLPAHRFVLEGYGLKAVKICCYGALFSILISAILSPIFIKILPIIYYNARGLVPVFLFLVSVHLILKEEDLRKKSFAILVFLCAGLLGFISLNLIDVNQPLFPLLTGFFGISNLILNMKNSVKIKEQKKKFNINIKKGRALNIVTSSSLTSIILGFIPTLSPAQISILSDEISKKENNEEYLLSVSSITSSYVIASLITFFTLKKARIGAFTLLREIPIFDMVSLLILLFTCVLSAILCFIISLKLSSLICNKINKINYRKLTIFSLVFVCLLVFIFSSYIGLLILIASTTIGYITIKTKIKRTNCMGCLIIPTMLWYLK
ncbi:MAG: tripartite tricarboxylate transporter permease [Candidatus Parvarchaeota archaeon]|nr:tripartite tricarboxylate transporter permease [Candidatus Jingweiarchaeum tengchongense]MCW1298382.1 tripartite tricarboxylate transporter permease [Candidatus Jingweiarchaeum tengchongense]MCW1300316.1 tripartite tricarboxylate transporter permease [Candidatus Jingweiarchaeum tengchongense]MCW1304887.1 tripartite tricarboxylate transporter permease [Candidatus Jingweiarchaeum tengchongense]MCW1305812.1 tripartite tricarboxylate transporter permease [Candidatus Jingweiarchaeum tengchongense